MSQDKGDFLEQLKADVAACKQLHAECTQLRSEALALLVKAKQFSQQNF
jgi:hypothetical protein